MDIIAKHSKGKILENDGLAISAKAKEAKEKCKFVINATVGSLYKDNGDFYKFNVVEETLSNLNDDEYYTYSKTSGDEFFHKACVGWVFGRYCNEIISKMFCKSIPTPGGTGAVSNAMYNALDKDETLLLPNIYWKPYSDMALSNSINVLEYEAFVDGKFNIDGFIKCANEIIKKQHKLVTIINDPCNNPTGYTLSNDEFLKIINYCNSLKDVPCNIIYDIAYFDYSLQNEDDIRYKFMLMTEANNNILFNIAFSCSKTFSVYGLRVGSQIILSKNEYFVSTIYQSTVFLARTRWSNVSKSGINLLTKIYNDSSLYNRFKKELEEAKNIVKRRANLFIKECMENDLIIYPYNGGFFITIIVDDGKKVSDLLIKNNIYTIYYKDAIRIAICSITIDEIRGLAKKIKDVITY